MSKVTPNTCLVLDSLRANNEGSGNIIHADGSVWLTVYLDNARPVGMSRRAFAGHLSALERWGCTSPQGTIASVTSDRSESTWPSGLLFGVQF